MFLYLESINISIVHNSLNFVKTTSTKPLKTVSITSSYEQNAGSNTFLYYTDNTIY